MFLRRKDIELTSDDMKTVVTVMAFLVQGGATIAAVVWTVAKIASTTDRMSIKVESTTENLRMEIRHLAEAVTSVKNWLTDVDRIAHDHESRLRVVENSHCQRRDDA